MIGLPEQPIDHAAEARHLLRMVGEPEARELAQIHAILALVDVAKDIRSELRRIRK